MTWAKVGAKCVCVNAGGFGVWMGDAPVEGRVYTISRVLTNSITSRVNLEFRELKRSDASRRDLGIDCGYWVDRFRPIVAKTQSEDVAMFKRIADQVPNMEMQE